MRSTGRRACCGTGTTSWVLLEGHPADIAAQAGTHDLHEVEGPPPLPPYRHSLPPAALGDLTGTFVAEIGVGIVHRPEPVAAPPPAAEVVELHRRLKERFDPRHRLNPGRDPLHR